MRELGRCEVNRYRPVHAAYDPVAPPGFCNRGEVRYGSIGGLEYEVPQSRLYCLCINVALCSTALQCICRVIRRSSMTTKAHTYYIIFGRPPIGGSFPLPPGGATALGTTFTFYLTCAVTSASWPRPQLRSTAIARNGAVRQTAAAVVTR